MSSDEVKEKWKETMKSATDLLDSVKRAANAELAKTYPKLSTSLDKSFDDASRALSDSLSIIDKSTREERRQLLKAYSLFLQKQKELIDRMSKSLDEKSSNPPDR